MNIPPQGPLYNPKLEEGIYNAEITAISHGKYGDARDSLYIRIVLRLVDLDKSFVTNLYFPNGKPHARSVMRSNALCRCLGGGSAQDLIDSPEAFKGAKLRVQILKMTSKGREYRDVNQFLPPVVELPEEPSPAAAQDKPKPPPVQYEMFDYDE